MRHLITLFLFSLPLACQAQESTYSVVTSDIPRFWEAYDAITASEDSTQQYALLDSLYLDRGSPGLHALIERRGYTPESYIHAILNYPRFWASIRSNTLRADAIAQEIAESIEQLRALHPVLRPAKIYFTVGALMTGGTTLDDSVLIGAEIAMADSSATTDELPDFLAENLRRYFDSNPVEDLVLLNIHEYIHTQQGPFGSNLLAVALQEGVAEFVSVQATGHPSATPAIAFGEANMERVRDRFSTEMFSPRWNDWLYNDFSNEFGVRDLGYYVGYAIAECYYEKAIDKTQAIAQLIELDYQDVEAVEALVEASGYLAESIDTLRVAYEQNVPTVVGISEFDNGDQNVSPSIGRMTITFSSPMNTRFRGFDYGPLGEEHVLRITRFVGVSSDRRSVTVEIELQPSHNHQLLLTSQFRDDEGRALEPYLIDLTTGAAEPID